MAKTTKKPTKTGGRTKKSKSAAKTNSAEYTAYTDGGCMFNPGGPGGYGVVIIDKSTGEFTQLSGGFKSTTNNRMEIMAAIVALQNIPDGASVNLFSDSEYMIKCFTNEWSRKKNTDLFDRLDAVAKGKKVTCSWVRGHNGDPLNELCDTLATEAMTGKELQDDSGYEMYKDQAKTFYEAVDKHEQIGTSGAMGVQIQVPKSLSGEVEYLSSSAYAEKYQVHTSCAKAILKFGMEKQPRFKSYLMLKTDGIDSWSRKKKEDLLADVTDAEDVLSTVENHLHNEKDTLTAIRWFRRGLPLADCIRKVLVDNEVSQNAIGRSFAY